MDTVLSFAPEHIFPIVACHKGLVGRVNMPASNGSLPGLVACDRLACNKKAAGYQ